LEKQLDPVAVLAYALYDAESSGRLGEDPGAQPEYFERARQLLYMIRTIRPKRERVCLARAIRRQ
jgi:hypothetical protein